MVMLNIPSCKRAKKTATLFVVAATAGTSLEIGLTRTVTTTGVSENGDSDNNGGPQNENDASSKNRSSPSCWRSGRRSTTAAKNSEENQNAAKVVENKSSRSWGLRWKRNKADAATEQDKDIKKASGSGSGRKMGCLGRRSRQATAEQPQESDSNNSNGAGRNEEVSGNPPETSETSTTTKEEEVVETPKIPIPAFRNEDFKGDWYVKIKKNSHISYSYINVVEDNEGDNLISVEDTLHGKKHSSMSPEQAKEGAKTMFEFDGKTLLDKTGQTLSFAQVESETRIEGHIPMQNGGLHFNMNMGDGVPTTTWTRERESTDNRIVWKSHNDVMIWTQSMPAEMVSNNPERLGLSKNWMWNLGMTLVSAWITYSTTEMAFESEYECSGVGMFCKIMVIVILLWIAVTSCCVCWSLPRDGRLPKWYKVEKKNNNYCSTLLYRCDLLMSVFFTCACCVRKSKDHAWTERASYHSEGRCGCGEKTLFAMCLMFIIWVVASYSEATTGSAPHFGQYS